MPLATVFGFQIGTPVQLPQTHLGVEQRQSTSFHSCNSVPQLQTTALLPSFRLPINLTPMQPTPSPVHTILGFDQNSHSWFSPMPIRLPSNVNRDPASLRISCPPQMQTTEAPICPEQFPAIQLSPRCENVSLSIARARVQPTTSKDMVGDWDPEENDQQPWIACIRMLLHRQPRSRTVIQREVWNYPINEEDPWLHVGTESTRQRHHVITTWLSRWMTVSNTRLLTLHSIALFLRSMAQARNWAKSTIASSAGSLLGALRRINHPIAKAPGWRHLLGALDAQANLDDVSWPEIMSISEIQRCVDQAPLHVGLFVWVCFRGALRVADAFHIRVRNIVHHTAIADDAWAALISGGKVSKKMSLPIYLRLGAKMNGAFQTLLESRQAQTWLWDDTHRFRTEILHSLRVVCPNASLRSLRGSRVLHLSMDGIPPHLIIKLTHHKSLNMLHRYQRWGLADAHTMKLVYNLDQNKFSEKDDGSTGNTIPAKRTNRR